MGINEEIIALEHEALDEWSGGNPEGYMDSGHADYTYCDNLGANQVIVGVQNAIDYARKMFSEMPEHDYVMVSPHVQHYGDAAILSYQYHPSANGVPQTKWMATVVYAKLDSRWTSVHSHWTMLQSPEQ